MFVIRNKNCLDKLNIIDHIIIFYESFSKVWIFQNSQVRHIETFPTVFVPMLQDGDIMGPKWLNDYIGSREYR